MAANFLKFVKNSVKHWYLPLLVGVLFVGVGIYMFTTPAESYLTLSIVFILVFIFSGVTDIVFSIANKDELDGWGWNLAGGILNLVIGGVLIIHPVISVVTLPLFVGFTVLFRSIMAISSSIELKSYKVDGWGNLLTLGILGVVFSIILLWNPMFAGLTVVVWTALAFIAFGIFNIYFSIKLKKVGGFPNKISKELKEKLHKVEGEIEHAIKKSEENLY